MQNCLGNFFWLIFGGLLTAFLYFINGLLLCLTIVGIPFGLQLFKFASFALCPFGRELRDTAEETSCLSTIMNVIWICCGWCEIAIVHFVLGLALCITIIGIPLGVQHFKLAIGSCLPFGKEVV